MPSTISYLLAPMPKWVIINNEGTLEGGALLYTYRNLDKTVQKPVFQDPAGNNQYTNPIIFDANGTQGPFYWQVDSSNADDTYYIVAYDSNGNFLWDVQNFVPPGGGGGGNATIYQSLTNLLTNNVFINHCDDTANPIGLQNLVIAPSNHHGFTPDLITPIVAAFGTVGPDIRFVKSNLAATDQLTFEPFPPGLDPLGGDSTPDFYLRYQCTNNPIGETFKCLQFPIQQAVNAIDNLAVTFSVWLNPASAVTMNVYVVQYFGSGGTPSVEARSLPNPITVPTGWHQHPLNFTIPSIVGKTLGTCGDSATYIQLEFPLNQSCDISLTKPCLFFGTLTSFFNFNTYDQIDTITQSARTGDIKTSLLSSAPQGWVAMNDTSIGSKNSGATGRHNVDTFFLYKTIWDGVSNLWAPIQDSTGAPLPGRGASAVDDFVADNRLVLPRSLGRALAGAGTGAGLTTRDLGEYLGVQSVQLAITEMPVHNHGPLAPQTSFVGHGANTGVLIQGGNEGGFIGTTADSGGTDAHTNMQPTSFFNVFIKL